MTFADLQEFFDPTLRLPIRGKEYVVPSPDAKTGVWCQRLLATGVAAASGVEVNDADLSALELDDHREQELYQRVLGSAWDQMQADGIPWEMVKHAGMTAFMWIAGDRAAAEAFWSTAPGEATRPQGRKNARKSAPRASRVTSNRAETPTSTDDSPTSSSPIGH